MTDLAAALKRLAELGPPSEIRQRTPGVAARTLDLDRVLLSRIESGRLHVEALHAESGDSDKQLADLRRTPMALAYPLIESEAARRRRAEGVRAVAGAPPGRKVFADVLGWTEYVAAPLLGDGRVIGFLHGDREASGRAIDENDAAALADFGVCFSLVFERAVLQRRLRLQHEELRRVAAWADSRTTALGGRSLSLRDDDSDADQGRLPTDSADDSTLRELLTRRELEVLELMVGGNTNALIARELVISEGTVKYHVKNVLRKLRVANRAEATSRYLRLTLPH